MVCWGGGSLRDKAPPPVRDTAPHTHSSYAHHIPGDLEPLTGFLNNCPRNRTFLAAKRGDSVLECGVRCLLQRILACSYVTAEP